MDFDKPRQTTAAESHPFGDLLRSAETLGSSVSHEGLSGFLHDPAGSVDRVVAEQQLRSRFDVVDDGSTGPRLPNQVTQDEFHAAAHDFSDARRGVGSLTLAPQTKDPLAAASFENGAMTDIAAMLQTTTGRQEVAQLSHGEHKTTISPYLKNGKPVPGAVTPPDSEEALRRDDGSRGAGSDADVHYNPGMVAKQSRSDVVLSHELRHAVDETSGNMDSSLVDASDGVPGDLKPDSNGAPVRRWDHQALGVGESKNEQLTENHYRDERRMIGTSADPEAKLPGDAEMAARPYYNRFR